MCPHPAETARDATERATALSHAGKGCYNSGMATTHRSPESVADLCPDGTYLDTGVEKVSAPAAPAFLRKTRAWTKTFLMRAPAGFGPRKSWKATGLGRGQPRSAGRTFC